MMGTKRRLCFWILGLALVAITSLIYFVQAAQWAEWTVSLEITGIWTRHGTPDNANLWVLTTATTNQEFSGQFTGYFWVEDMQGDITGHYTTIQCDGIYGPGWYILTWIYLKAGNNTPTLIQWITGNVLIASELYDYTNILNPMTYIYEPTDISNAWLPNRYWDKPRFKIIIPAYAPPGIYSGTIVFSYYSY